MKSSLLPKTGLGKLSVGLHTFFVIVIAASLLLVNVLGVLNFDDRWWDVTVPIAFQASITALITGITAVRRRQESSVLVFLSFVLGLCVILFVLLHSLFISD